MEECKRMIGLRIKSIRKITEDDEKKCKAYNKNVKGKLVMEFEDGTMLYEGNTNSILKWQEWHHIAVILDNRPDAV